MLSTFCSISKKNLRNNLSAINRDPTCMLLGYSLLRGKKRRKIKNKSLTGPHTLQSETANRKCYAAGEVFPLLQQL